MENDRLILLVILVVIVVLVLFVYSRQISVVDHPVDIVYSWIDGNDPYVKEQIQYWREIEQPLGEAGTSNRFNTMDELRYSLRSVYQFAPWVRNVYIVTSFHIVPDWFDEKIGAEHGIYFIDDSELLDTVPVFNSLAKEAVKHRIPGLSDRYLYFNDDLFFGSAVEPLDFQDSRGRAYAFHEPNNFVVDSIEQIDEGDYFSEGLLYTRNTLVRLFPELKNTPMQLKKHTPDLHFVTEDYDKWLTIPEEMQRTADGRFRDVDQIYDNTLFDNYWKRARGVGVPGDISYAYLYISGNLEKEEFVYDHIRRERPKVFCINDGIKDETPQTLLSIELFADFLEGYFPQKAPWEI